ncbi:ATPase, T2SS/T4P/T4SS family [Trinickia mobilis]|uniref:ATPase, T2SS/T4P/T4SS family n=1 Tax=Trinickia mobilis TaxID=2816356 RepID=UPI001A8C4FB6|nr:ATPase, T2SS/T4P/T4SS family [Trinickia mobilis]
MLKISIHQRDGSAQIVEIGGDCTIGRGPACSIVLTGMLVGKLHATIENRAGRYYLNDRGGFAATLVNGNAVNAYGPLLAGDTIEIAGFVLTIDDYAPPAMLGAQPAADVPALREGNVHVLPAAHALAGVSASAAAPLRSPAAARQARVHVEPAPSTQADSAINSRLGIEIRKAAHQQLVAAIDMRRLNVSRMDDAELRLTVGEMLDEILDADPRFNTDVMPRALLKKSVFDEAIGLGPLEALLADDTVSEIMVNRYDEIFVERAGRIQRAPVIFTDDRAVVGTIERIVAPLGRRIDESSPMVDARLKDGSRVNAVIAPLSLKGASLTIRKFSAKKLTGEDLVDFGTLSAEMLEFLRVAVEQRANIVISGGTGSGKTTLLNVLSSFIPASERIVTVEDAAELQLAQPNLVSLEARPANMEGKGAVPIRELVKNCLRMRPDRIVVGECRGGEALDMLQAMNTGHDGSLTTAHANTPRDCLARLEVMTMMAGLELPLQAIRDQICSAVNLIVQQTRFACGSRRITHITEISGIESGTVQLQDIFLFRENGYGAHGKINGHFAPTSHIPDLYQGLSRRGIPVDISIFSGSVRDRVGGAR